MANANIFEFDSGFIERVRSTVAQFVTRARYKAGDTWYATSISERNVLSDGRIEIKFVIDHTVVGSETVTEIELQDYQFRKIGGKKVSITRADATEGILYVCRMDIFQVIANTGETGEYDRY